jgi:beta-xylosidase
MTIKVCLELCCCGTLAVLIMCARSAFASGGQSNAQKAAASLQDLQEVRSAAGSWGDQRDGTYLNPVLPADFSDIDAIRVNDDFYAISSTMQYSPGMVVLHSRDLVNWTIAGHIVPDISVLDPELDSDRMNRDGRGLWAGSLRYHAGRLWVYFGTPDGGIYMTSSKHPEGPWTLPKPVISAAGWDDPCPFWDNDGKGYLVATRFSADADGEKYRIHLFALNSRSDEIVASSDRILHQSRGSEANKLYKIDGVYFHYFSEVKPEGRVAMMERSRSLSGPWEVQQLNHVHGMVDKEPNQGGLVQLKNGTWWFLTHQGKGDWEGRAGVLLPVTWKNGWPLLGQPGPDGIGEMVWGGSSPIPSNAQSKLFVSDSFRDRSLLPAWEWRYQPKPDAWSFTKAGIRLQALMPIDGRPEFAGTRDVLTQRSARAEKAEVTVTMNLTGLVDKQEAGLAHFAKTSCRIAVVQTDEVRKLVRFDDGVAMVGPLVSSHKVWLRSTWGVEGVANFSYSLDGSAYKEFGGPCRLSWGSYRGDRIGLYTFNSKMDKGSVDFSDFRYQVR